MTCGDAGVELLKLYNFPSFPSMTYEEHRRLTYTACMIFNGADSVELKPQHLQEHLEQCHCDDPTSPYFLPYYGPNDTTFEEFLQLPEISCIVYMSSLTVGQKCRETYRSHMTSFSRDVNKFHNFRFCVVQCLMDAKKDETNLFGAMTLEKFCDSFNRHKRIQQTFGWKLRVSGKIDFLNNGTLLDALCTFCSRDIVVHFGSRKPPCIRLRNHPKYLLFNQIEPERALAEKAVAYFDYYKNKNPENLVWTDLGLDSVYIASSPTTVIPCPSYFLDNVYAAFHCLDGIHDFDSLSTAITEYTKHPLDTRIQHHITTKFELNLLLDMVSSSALEAVEFWDKEKSKIYMDIVYELSEKLDEEELLFLFNFIEKNPKKPDAINRYWVWAFNKMAKHLLFVLRDAGFIDEQQIAEKISYHFQYDIYEWLMNFGLDVIADLFQYERLKNTWLSAICIKKKNNEYHYKNMANILMDSTLYDGFPFTARKRLVNCLQEGNINPNWSNHDGGFDEKTVEQIYFYCYEKNLDAEEKESLFGDSSFRIAEFLETYLIDDIDFSVNENGEMIYRLTKNFNETFNLILQDKKKCYNSLKRWIGMNYNDLDIKMCSQSLYTSWIHQRYFDYGLEVLKRTRIFLSRR